MMNLPKLEIPTYTTTLPGCQKKITYRPYTVKEEKILLLAQESGNSTEMLNAMINVADVCTMGKLKISDLQMVDVEWLFLKLKSKSSGEIVNLQFTCENCGTREEHPINLDDLKIKYPDKKLSNKIMLSDTVGIMLCKPTIGLVQNSSDEDLDKNENVIRASTLSIFDSNNVYDVSKVSNEEFNTFIDSLTEKQLLPIMEYIKDTPEIFIEHNWKCKACGHENKTIIKGFENFF